MESLKDMVNHFSCMIYEYADRAEMQWTMVKSVKDSSRLLDFLSPIPHRNVPLSKSINQLQ